MVTPKQQLGLEVSGTQREEMTRYPALRDVLRTEPGAVSLLYLGAAVPRRRA